MRLECTSARLEPCRAQAAPLARRYGWVGRRESNLIKGRKKRERRQGAN